MSYSYGFSSRLVLKMFVGDSFGWYKGCIFIVVCGYGLYMFFVDEELNFELSKVMVSGVFDF